MSIPRPFAVGEWELIPPPSNTNSWVWRRRKELAPDGSLRAFPDSRAHVTQIGALKSMLLWQHASLLYEGEVMRFYGSGTEGNVI